MYIFNVSLDKSKPQKMGHRQFIGNFFFFLIVGLKTYQIYRMYWDSQGWPNSVAPNEMLQNATSHQGLHCLPLIQQFLDTALGSKLYMFKF